MKTRLIVLRHGNTFNPGDVILRVGSRTDLPLTERGREQAREAARRLKQRRIMPHQYVVAPLIRTTQTADTFIDVFPIPEPLSFYAFLTELDYGEDDGRPETEVVLDVGRAEAERAGLALSDDELTALGKEALSIWDKDAVLPTRWRFLQERIDELPNQWRQFADKLLEYYPGENTLVVTSNGVARFSTAILPPNAPRPDSLKLATGKFGIYEYDSPSAGWRLTEWNV